MHAVTKKLAFFSRFIFAGMLMGLCSHTYAALSQDPSLHWQTLTTKHFEIHFHDDEETLARKVGAISEEVHTKLSKKFNWVPRERTQVILTDRFDFANGWATPLPRNTMSLLVTPPVGNSTISDHDNWLELLIVHEYTHILHLDKVSGLPANVRKVLGRNLFTFPNGLQPPWVIEGLATYEETDNARGIGRGQGTLFRGLMRQEVANGIKPIRQANQPLVSWPLNTLRYLYGVYFFQFIADRYGEDKPMWLVNNYSNNLWPFAINGNSQYALGKDMTQLWAEFNDYLKKEFAPEIAQIKQAGEITGTALTHSGYYSRSPKIANNGDIYFLENDLQSEPQLMLLKKGATKAKSVADVRGSSFDLHPRAGIIGTEINAVDNLNYFSDIYHLDKNTNGKTLLTHGKRYLQAAWSSDGENIIAIHNALGEHALHLLDAQGKKLDTLWQGEDSTVISSIDWSTGSDNLVAAVWRPTTLWNLETFDIKTRQWTLLTHSTAIENSPSFSSDGKHIVFSADYDGVFNIYQLSLDDNSLSKLSNVIGEATSPALHKTANGNELVYINLVANGYDVFRIKKTKPATIQENKDTVVSKTLPREHVALQETSTEPYNALTRIAPTSWFPYFIFDDVRSEIGFTTSGSDPLHRHNYNLLLGYDIDNQWALGRFNYIYDRWNPTLKFSFGREILAYLDNNDNVERYRDSDVISAEAVWPFFRYERQWLLHAGLLSEKESDKKIFSNLSPATSLNDQLVGLAITYNSAEKYARSISPSDGRQIRLIAEDSETLDSDFTGQVYSLDWRELIDLPGQHVLSARAVLGWGTETPRAFRLGGTLETSVPPVPQSAVALTENIFGQRRYPLHGYKQGRADLRGRRMALVEAEWRFPIALIERGFMAPPVGLHQVHGKLIYNWGESWDQGSDIPDLRRGAGIEFTAEMVLGYWLPMDLRVGFAKGFDLGGEEQAYIEARIPLF